MTDHSMRPKPPPVLGDENVRLKAAATEEDRAPGLPLVPRFTGQGYAIDQVRDRRAWIEREIGVELPLVGACAIPTEQMRGNIENPIGSVQMPLGVAGPLLVNGEHARGTFYVPLATTEGALVCSYARGV